MRSARHSDWNGAEDWKFGIYSIRCESATNLRCCVFNNLALFSRTNSRVPRNGEFIFCRVEVKMRLHYRDCQFSRQGVR